MTRIHVNPKELRHVAQRLDDMAGRIRALGREAREITVNAPSHEGQFGPKARTMGLEAEARLLTQAERTSALSEELIARAKAFEDADQRSLEALSQLGESMNEWTEHAGLVLAPLVMASAFPWQLIHRHLRLGALLGPGDISLEPLPPPPIGPDPPEGIPLRVWYHLPRDDQLVILMEIASEGKPEPTVWVPLVRPLFIDPEAWLRLPLEDQQSIVQWIQDWPAIHGIAVGSTRYVRANLDELNKVWYYDEDGNLVETDLSYFGVEALSGEMWVEYDYEEVTRSISEEELLNESEQSVAVRLIISEVGADRIVDNQNGLYEGVGICWTVENRLRPEIYDPERYGVAPYGGGGEEGTFISVATSGRQYRGIKSSLGLSPYDYYLGSPSEEKLPEAVDIAVVAYGIQSGNNTGSVNIEDITQGATEIGAVEYRHRCGPPGHDAYGHYTTECDEQSEILDGAHPHKGPLIFLAKNPKKFNIEEGYYWLMETGVVIDYVPKE
jgi:hypothetical protein